MIGTIVNTCAIVMGTIVGTVLNRGIKEKYKTGLYDALGLASLAIGLNATITNLPKSQYPVLFIVALAIGTVVGTRLDIDGCFHRLVNKTQQQETQQQKTHPQPLPIGRGVVTSAHDNSSDESIYSPPYRVGPEVGLEGHSGRSLADGLSTATLLYCIGPLSMLGPVIAALQGDNTFLFTNATLDFVSSTIFAATYGIGMMLAAPVLFLWQGFFYMVAKLSSQAVSDALMAELLIVGGLMILGSGLNLLKLKELKTLNLLPALLVPPLWFLLKYWMG